ncbi:putative membrane protein [Sphingomonas sp. UYAg733]
MQNLLIIVLSLHVLAATFWAGTTFVLARAGGNGAAALTRPRFGAALIAFLTGGYLWHAVHEGNFGTAEKILAAGIGCAIIAVLVQILSAIKAKRQREAGTLPAQGGNAAAERLSAVLLVVTVICMAASRYA